MLRGSASLTALGSVLLQVLPEQMPQCSAVHWLQLYTAGNLGGIMAAAGRGQAVMGQARGMPDARTYFMWEVSSSRCGASCGIALACICSACAGLACC